MGTHYEIGRHVIPDMNIRIRYLFLILAFIFTTIAEAQPLPPNQSLIALKHYVTVDNPKSYDTGFTDLHYVIGENLNYLYPVYQLLGDDKNLWSHFLRRFIMICSASMFHSG
jgi:hypothetical protein